MTTPQEILTAVRALPQDLQFQVVEQILEQFSPPAGDVTEEEFAAELLRRDADFESGTAGGVSWAELRGRTE